MDPELFNQFGSMVGESVASGSGFAAVPTADDFSSMTSGIGGFGSFAGGLSTALGIVGDVANIFGELQVGKEEQEAYNYNAALALEQGDIAVEQLGTKEVGVLSTQRAMYGKAGVAMTGSPIDTAVNTASQFEMDKQIETYNAKSAAAMDTYEGEVARQQSKFKASMSLLGDIGDVAGGLGMLAFL